MRDEDDIMLLKQRCTDLHVSPDAVHIGKNLLASALDHFLSLHGYRFSIGTLRCLLEDSDLSVRQAASSAFSLADTTGKDRQAPDTRCTCVRSRLEAVHSLTGKPNSCGTATDQAFCRRPLVSLPGHMEASWFSISSRAYSYRLPGTTLLTSQKWRVACSNHLAWHMEEALRSLQNL